MSLARLDPQSVGPHDAIYPLMIDEVATPVKLVRRTTVPVEANNRPAIRLYEIDGLCAMGA